MKCKEPASPQIAVNPRQAASLLGISERTLWTLTKGGEIPHFRIGRCVRYQVSALETWVASQQQGGAQHV